jgi:hypothetical protein
MVVMIVVPVQETGIIAELYIAVKAIITLFEGVKISDKIKRTKNFYN